ncbi:MAG: hypothetical protein F4186_09735 [Boseongicola sp. SB0676_bin_33]|nr:hypothetical protein [Boseongicola sp. SB0676_bin_33]
MTSSPQAEHERVERHENWVSRDPVHRIRFQQVLQASMIRRSVRQFRCARNGELASIGKPSVEIVYGSPSQLGRPPTLKRSWASAPRTGQGSAPTGPLTTP